MNLLELNKPFAPNDIKWRVQNQGDKKGKPWAIIIPYLDARAIMDRLDAVCSPENWQDEYNHVTGGVECRISIYAGSRWVYKVDGAEETKVEAFKGGYSKSFVRCAVKWGMGRYLYNTPTVFADTMTVKPDGKEWSSQKNSKADKPYWYYWKVPDKVNNYFSGLCEKKSEKIVIEEETTLDNYVMKTGEHEGICLKEFHLKELAKYYQDNLHITYPQDDEKNAMNRTDLISIEYYLKRFDD